MVYNLIRNNVNVVRRLQKLHYFLWLLLLEKNWHSEEVKLTCAWVEQQICNNDFELMLQFNDVATFPKIISFHFTP